MRMQEPEQERQSGQERQASQEYGGYRVDYSRNYESEQQQKIYPTEERRLYGNIFLIFSVVLSSIGFFLTVAGIVASAIVLKFANGHTELLAAGVIGLVSSIGAMLICVAIFVMAVVALALAAQRRRRRGWTGTSMSR